MEETLTPEQTLSLTQAVPYMLGFAASRFWVDYDQDADVLYALYQLYTSSAGYGYRHDGRRTPVALPGR